MYLWGLPLTVLSIPSFSVIDKTFLIIFNNFPDKEIPTSGRDGCRIPTSEGYSIFKGYWAGEGGWIHFINAYPRGALKIKTQSDLGEGPRIINLTQRNWNSSRRYKKIQIALVGGPIKIQSPTGCIWEWNSRDSDRPPKELAHPVLNQPINVQT